MVLNYVHESDLKEMDCKTWKEYTMYNFVVETYPELSLEFRKQNIRYQYFNWREFLTSFLTEEYFWLVEEKESRNHL